MPRAAKIRASRSWLLALGAIASMGLLTAPAHAGYMVNSDENFSYTGTVTAPDGTAYAIPSYVSTPGTTTYTGRDASIFTTSGAPTADAGAGGENYTLFQTNWYSSLNGQNNGNNPNDTDTGFVTLQDTTNHYVTSANGRWTNAAMTDFQLIINGTETGTTANDDERLWAAPEVGGASGDTYGVFTGYTLTLNATFAPGSVTNESPHWWSTTATPLSITGSFTGTFQNTSTTTPSNQGTYKFDLTFQPQNWAGANNIPDTYGPTYFGATVPEPATFALFGTGLLGLVLLRRRRA